MDVYTCVQKMVSDRYMVQVLADTDARIFVVSVEFPILVSESEQPYFSV